MYVFMIATLKELLLSLIGKIAFKILLERLVTRVLVVTLRSLAKKTTNTVDDETVEDVISILHNKKLSVITELTDG